MKKLFTIIALAGYFLPFAAHAAKLTIASGSIILDTQGESVNAIDLHLTFDPADFAVRDLNDGGSIINIWVQRPAASNTLGTLDLAGIIPGGTVAASGTIVRFSIDPKKAGTSAGFTITSAEVFLNDGKGTPASLAVESAPFTFPEPYTATSAAPLPPDTEAPDPFIPEVAHDSSMFGGKYFLTFSTTDQASGIDHYEVLEVPAGETDGGDITNWQTAESPYLLHDQTLSSDIYVRAVDVAGNFRTVKLPAERAAASVPANSAGTAVLWGILIAGMIVIGLIIKRKWRRS